MTGLITLKMNVLTLTQSPTKGLWLRLFPGWSERKKYRNVKTPINVLCWDPVCLSVWRSPTEAATPNVAEGVRTPAVVISILWQTFSIWPIFTGGYFQFPEKCENFLGKPQQEVFPWIKMTDTWFQWIKIDLESCRNNPPEKYPPLYNIKKQYNKIFVLSRPTKDKISQHKELIWSVSWQSASSDFIGVQLDFNNCKHTITSWTITITITGKYIYWT